MSGQGVRVTEQRAMMPDFSSVPRPTTVMAWGVQLMKFIFNPSRVVQLIAAHFVGRE